MSDFVEQDPTEQISLDDGPFVAEEHRGPLAYVARTRVSRRNFIKGVIASGAAVSASGYMVRGTGISSARAATVGAVERLISLKRVEVPPNETLAITLRYKLG